MHCRELCKQTALPIVLLLIAAALYLTGCAEPAAQAPTVPLSQRDYAWAQDWVNSIRYHRDEASGLCFASSWVRTGDSTKPLLTYVPCTSQVEALIEKAKQKAEKQ